MLNRERLRKNGPQHRALRARLGQSRTRYDTHGCAQILTIMDRTPLHAMFACHDGSLRLCTSRRAGRTFADEIVMTPETYQQRTESRAARIPVMRRDHWRR